MSIAENIMTVRGRIKSAVERCGRNAEDITLIAVTKTHPASTVDEAVRCGIRDIGENRVQEAEKKFGEVKENAVWHFIGHLQRNKVRNVVKFCNVLHSVDSVGLASEINKRREKPIDIFVEVNIGEEAAKSGVFADETIDFLKQIREFPNLRCRGLMTIPPLTSVPKEARPFFAQVAEIQKEANRLALFDDPLTDLSMGMTDDFEVAIEEGATMIRVGRAIFGPRMPRT